MDSTIDNTVHTIVTRRIQEAEKALERNDIFSGLESLAILYTMSTYVAGNNSNLEREWQRFGHYQYSHVGQFKIVLNVMKHRFNDII
jgi:hypothetical protein